MAENQDTRVPLSELSCPILLLHPLPLLLQYPHLPNEATVAKPNGIVKVFVLTSLQPYGTMYRWKWSSSVGRIIWLYQHLHV